MAATRKLQGEIDRCLKKVSEGVETFEDIWKKVHNATNSNQKEKYEADLKKEIKKLQRLRDQIKSWIASAEIKDKSSLLENRRLIETQMERFKVVERETKTKAYSKEGLGAAQKIDPAQRIKDDTRNWITNSISSLKLQIDHYESEVESLLAAKKKRLDRDKQDRMDELTSKLERHKFHVTKLETLLRLLDNDSVEPGQVIDIKENVEYYINSSQDPGFEEDEYIYDEIIGPDEVELSGTGVSLDIPSSATTDSNNSNETSGSPSSITSGGSPVQSPGPVQHSSSTGLQQQQPILHSLNYSSDSTNLDTTSEKRSKMDNTNSKAKQPVKPTAVRAAASKSSSGSISDGSANSKIVSSTPSKNHPQPQQPTAATVVATAVNSSGHTTNPGGLSMAINSTAGHNPPVQPHAPAPSLSSSAVSTAPASGVINTNSIAAVANNNIQGQSVIQATPTIAFAAVAKNNTSHLENGLVHPATSFAMAAPTVATVVGSNAQHQQQQPQQLSNLQTNSSHNIQNATLNASTPANSITNSAQQSGNAANNVGSSNNAGTNSNNNNNSNNNSLTNCISPNGMVGLSQIVINAQQQQQQIMNVVNSTRASPGLLSPKHMNGLPVAIANNNSVDAISLKTMAQEAINRSVIDTTPLSQGPNVDTRQQQQQQQQVLQHFSNESTANAQQQQNNAAAVAAAAAAAAAAISNGPTSTNSSTVGSAIVNLTGSNTVQISNAATSGNLNKVQQPTHEAHIPPLLGVAPLGPSPLHKDHQMQFQMMEAAYYHLPTPSDSEKLTTYFHRTPVQTPSYYPQSQLPMYDTVEFYQRLSTETLFFVFYYMEGSKAQYLAAKALKKQSWRFHTKYMMWFQRHEEPKIINDDYEQGTYIYFDYEKWSQRKKEGFTFEYKYLEDKELN